METTYLINELFFTLYQSASNDCKYKEFFPCQMLFGYEKGLEVAIDLFQNWLNTQIVGIDTNTKEILVVKGDEWELAINEFKEYIKNDYRI